MGVVAVGGALLSALNVQDSLQDAQVFPGTVPALLAALDACPKKSRESFLSRRVRLPRDTRSTSVLALLHALAEESPCIEDQGRTQCTSPRQHTFGTNSQRGMLSLRPCCFPFL